MMDGQSAAIEASESIPAAAFPVANEHGVFAEIDCETIYAPVLSGVCATIQVIEQADGWRFGWSADLPEGGHGFSPAAKQAPAATRGAAIVGACEDMIVWLSGEKEKGSKRHQRLATKTQDWALELSKNTPAVAAADVEAPSCAPDSSSSVDTEGEFVATCKLLIEANREELRTPASDDGEIRMIPLAELFDSPLNPRQEYAESGIKELAESMRQSGYRKWLPMMVRPIPEQSAIWRPVGMKGGYEIGAGHRRRRAAELAGLTEVPCVVRALSDAEFDDVLNFDNEGREDVHPLRKAAGWRGWMDRTGKGVLDVATRIGKSKEYVYQLLKYDHLIADAKQAFLRNEFTADHAIRIARRPADVQKKALAFLKPNPYDGRIPSTRDLDRWLHQSQTMDLTSAQFDREDAMLLAGAGTCGVCPKRSGNDPGFVAPEGMQAVADLCTDPRCYQQKADNHLIQLRGRLEQELGGTVLQVSTVYGTKKKGVLVMGDFDQANETDADAQVALVVEGANAGKVMRVRLRAPAKADGSTPAGPTPDEVKGAEDRRRVKVERELSIRRAILTAVKARVGGLSRADIEALLVKHFGGFDVEGETICELHGIAVEGAADGLGATAALCQALPKMKENELYAVVVEAAIIEDLAEWRAEQEPVGLLNVAKRYKVDAVKIRRAMEEKAKAAEGGTRREVGKPKKAAKPAAEKAATKKAAKPAAKKAAPKKAGVSKAAAGLIHRLHTGAGKGRALKGGKK